MRLPDDLGTVAWVIGRLSAHDSPVVAVLFGEPAGSGAAPRSASEETRRSPEAKPTHPRPTNEQGHDARGRLSAARRAPPA
jgi:hypothetical protein